MAHSALTSRVSALWIVAGAAAIWGAAFAAALVVGPGPGPLLDGWGAGFEGLGGALHGAGRLGQALRWPLLVVFLALAGWALAKRRSAPSAAAEAEPTSTREIALLLAVLALFSVSCLSRLDVFPDLDFDELSYAVAARMQLGELERTWVMGAHPFSRFQAQPLPLWLQAAGVGVSGPGILPIRLVSGLLGAAALLTTHFALRGRIGVRASLTTVALCSVTPLFLASSRAGHYIAFSLWHGTLCLAVLLRLVERRDALSALGLGALLGVALYAYQLSWFVPLLAAAAYLVSWETAHWRRMLARGAVVAGTAAMMLIPAALWLQGGLLAVLAQTLDKAVWTEPVRGGPGARDIWHQPVVLARAGDAPGTRALVDLARSAGLRATALPGDSLEPIVHVSGPEPVLRASLGEIEARGGEVLLDASVPSSPAGQARRMLAQLFRSPSIEFAVRVVEAPLLGAVMGPLVALGALEAWRRRRQPVMRILLVWAIGGALLPAAIGGTVARRSALMLPAVCALAALPLAALARESTGLAARWRRLAHIGVAVVLLTAAADGLHGYFRHWHRDVRAFSGAAPSGSLLELGELLRSLPRDRPALLPRHFRVFKPYWLFVEERPPLDPDAHISEWPGATTAERIREISCARRPPFTWVATEAQRELFAGLARDHRIAEGSQGAYRLWQVEARVPGGCAAGEGRR